MNVNLSAFREPRGVMRVFHFIFSICAFATITGYSGYVLFKCPATNNIKFAFDYPFQLTGLNITVDGKCFSTIIGNFSSDSQFFVATGVLAMLYSLAVSVIYVKYDDLYKSNKNIPLIDFVMTVFFAILWLSSSAAWAHALSGIKNVTDSPDFHPSDACKDCSHVQSSFSTLNISVIFGFLNFFLWAADLWFLYKETSWFQGNQPQTNSEI